MNKHYSSIHGWGKTNTVRVDIKTPKNLEEINDIIEKSARESILPRGLGPVSYTHLTLPTNREV